MVSRTYLLGILAVVGMFITAPVHAVASVPSQATDGEDLLNAASDGDLP